MIAAISDFLRQQFWSPYAAGIGIGLVSWLTFLFSNHPLGVSSAFAKTAATIEKALFGAKAANKPYYKKYKPSIDWRWLLVVGMFLGSFTSAWLSDSIRWIWVPPMWAQAFGPGTVSRLLAALAGGILVGFGARWASGCTSGHGVSGTLQLVIGSWISVVCFFIGGIAAAFFLYRVLV